MKRRMWSMLALALLAGFMAGIIAPASLWAGPLKLSYANFPPAPTFPCVQMERWKTEVEKRTGGKVAINTYPGGTLLGAKNMMDGVIAGTADIGNLCMAYQPGRFMVTNATALPLGVPNARVGSLALLSLWEKYQPEAFAQVKVLTMFTCAPANIYAKVPVRNLDDLKGLQLRASGGVAQVLGALGATAVGMPQSETPEALQKGVVKGAASSLETLKDFKYAEMCKYVTIINGPIYPFAVVMNRARWDGLPDDVKKVMDDLKVEQAEWTGNYMDNHVNEAIKWSKETQGVTFITLAADEQAKWDARLQPLTDKWIADAKSKGLPAEAIVQDIRNLIAKYSH